MIRKPELLLPAGSPDVLRTAFDYGADAVYLGGEAFGLRAMAKNFSAEEMDAHEMVNLIYVSLKAILKGNLPLEFLRKVYECRIMAENGVFAPPDQPGSMEQSAWYALQYTAACKVTELYSFRLSERAEVDYSAYIKKMLKRTVDRPMKSLALLEVMTE